MKKPKHKKISHQIKAARISLLRSLRVFIKRTIFLPFATVVLFVIMLFSFLWYEGDIKDFIEDGNKEIATYIANFGDHENQLQLHHIFLEGQNYTKIDNNLDNLNLKIGEPIMAISLPDIKERLENIKWIKTVAIERHLPNSLHIHILEHFPVALWQKDKKLYIIDKDGEIIDDSNIGDFANYPIVIGDDASLHVNELLYFLKSNKMAKKRLSSASPVGMRRWNLHLRNGIIIKMHELDIQSAWQKLERLHKKEMVLDRKVQSIDLRIPGRLSVHYPPKGHNS